METLTKYENLTGKEVKIVDIETFDDEGNSYPWLGISIGDYISLDLTPLRDKDILQIFVDYVNQFREIDNNQLLELCQRFTEVYYQGFSKTDVEEEFRL